MFHEDLEEVPDSYRIRYLPTRKTIDQTCSPVNRHLSRAWEPDDHQLGSRLDVWTRSGRLVLHTSRTCLLSRSIVVTDSPVEAGVRAPQRPRHAPSLSYAQFQTQPSVRVSIQQLNEQRSRCLAAASLLLSRLHDQLPPRVMIIG